MKVAKAFKFLILIAIFIFLYNNLFVISINLKTLFDVYKWSEPAHSILIATKNRTNKPALQNNKNSKSVFEALRDFIDVNTKKLKIYVSDIQNDLNHDAIKNRSNYGHGDRLTYYNDTSMADFYTDQFAIDAIFYHRLKSDDTVVTKNVAEANVVYIPFLIGSVCCQYRINNSMHNPVYLDYIHNMTLWLQENEQNFKGKLLLLIFSRIEGAIVVDCGIREDSLSILNKYLDKLYTLTIENYYQPPFLNKTYTRALTPYPTLSKFALKPNQLKYEYDINEERKIDVLTCANPRKKGKLRQFIFDKMNITYSSFKQYQSVYNNSNGSKYIIYIFGWFTPKSVLESSEWKLNSKFCFEPHGDTKTRRSFWDSIMLGCIPVIQENIDLPFVDQIDYSRFVINLNLIEKELNETDFKSVMRTYLENKQWIQNARDYMKQIRQFIQFTWIFNESNKPIDATFKYDAYGMLLANLAKSL